MDQSVLNIVLSAVSIIVTGLISWATGVLISFLNEKIKDRKLAKFLTGATAVVTDAVQAVYQTWVEALKAEGKFDKEAQERAKQQATDMIKCQLTNEMMKYIEDNFGDVSGWISEKIESVIYTLKNKNKGGAEE